MKRTLLLSGLILFSLIGSGQEPLGYYDATENLGGEALKTALYNIIKGHKIYEYTADTTDIWDILKDGLLMRLKNITTETVGLVSMFGRSHAEILIPNRVLEPMHII